MDNRNEFIPLINEGKPIQYWIGFIGGYMLRTIESTYPETLNEVLNETPTLRYEFRKSKITKEDKLIREMERLAETVTDPSDIEKIKNH
jgi:hypothetical protein